MLEHLRAPFKKLIEPIAKALIAIGLTANAVTVIGAVGTIVVAIATGQQVIPRREPRGVAAAPADIVIARAAIDRVIAARCVDMVIAKKEENHGIAVARIDEVVKARCGDIVV